MLLSMMMLRIQNFFKNYWPALLSGILMGTSYIPLPPWAIWFCFAPLYVQILQRSKNPLQAFWAGWWTQFILSLIGFHWVAYVAHEFGYFPWPVSLIFLFLFAAGVHLYYALACAISFWLRRHLQLGDGKTLFTLVALISLSEAWWPSLFPWNLGYTQLASQTPLAQWADVVGFWGLSLVFHAFSALTALLWIQPKSKLRWTVTGSGALALLALWLGGPQHGRPWLNTREHLQILQIQANIGNLEKVYAEKGQGFQAQIAQQYFQLTRQGLNTFPESELILWPESAYPDSLDSWDSHRSYSRLFYEFAQEIKKPILTGGYSTDAPGSETRRDYNGLFLFDENGKLTAPPYHKTYLLAYGEYTPGVDIFPWMAKLSPAGLGFGRGSGPTVMKFKDTILGLQICYESLYPPFTENLVKQGADILINLTNDSWFGPSFEPQQHMFMTLARGLEARRPLIRTTNTGISTAILASGEVLEKSPLFKTWFGSYDIRYKKNAELTFYVKYGTVLPWLLFAMLGAVLIADRYTKRPRI